MPQYKVLVGNIGTIYTGRDLQIATERFTTYVEMSKDGYGRVAHEDVTLLKDGEILREHPGSIDESLEDA